MTDKVIDRKNPTFTYTEKRRPIKTPENLKPLMYIIRVESKGTRICPGSFDKSFFALKNLVCYERNVVFNHLEQNKTAACSKQMLSKDTAETLAAAANDAISGSKNCQCGSDLKYYATPIN